VTAVAISEEIDETSDLLEFDNRGTQDESMSELKKEMEELKTKLEEEKAKANALLSELKEMKQQLVNLRTRCDNFENKSFFLNQFKNGKAMGFYTGFTDGEILMLCTIFVTLVKMAKISVTGTRHPQTRTLLF